MMLEMMTRREIISGLTIAAASHGADGMTAAEVMERIFRETGAERRANTVDTLKAGDPSTVVKGIATSFAATLDVMQRASKAGKNLIVAHEPTFYNHLDKTEWLTGDAVYEAKQS